MEIKKALLEDAFKAGVREVLPDRILPAWLQKCDNPKCRTFDLAIGPTDGALMQDQNQVTFKDLKGVKVIGFGKASLAMAAQVADVLGRESIMTGSVLSAPSTLELQSDLQGFEVHRGAANNLPDEAAASAAARIIQEVQKPPIHHGQQLTLVLVSGGGSALLPAPVAGLDLDTKTQLIRSLHEAGAAIQEVNTVRTVLSRVKGGKLAAGAHPDIPLVSLIISDIVGDPIDLIASGPTVTSRLTEQEMRQKAKEILIKYRIQVPQEVMRLLDQVPPDITKRPENLHNFVVVNNRFAVETCANEVRRRFSMLSDPPTTEQKVVVLPMPLTGDCRDLARSFAELGLWLASLDSSKQTSEDCRQRLGWDEKCEAEFGRFMAADSTLRDLVVVGGGETTAVVTGKGKGGRNQEMALVVARALGQLVPGYPCQVGFMSAGTDGIDGPTDAAGAVVHGGTCEDVAKQLHLDPEHFLANNDSYNFFKLLNDSEPSLIFTGHTGTNVMDVQMIWVSKNQ